VKLPGPGRRAGASPRPPAAGPPASGPRPGSSRVVLDVREDLRAGREPFAQIMAAVADLARDGVLVLRTPFEPQPLYRVLGRRGLVHVAEQGGPEDWTVTFYWPEAGASPAGDDSGRGHEPLEAGLSRLDVRGLEPPLPLVRVLERLDTLEPDEGLEVLHDRRPLLLYPQLEDRGFRHETDEPAPGLVRIRIRRGGSDS
jgi:uncharacterized protein (DUF2249 family)